MKKAAVAGIVIIIILAYAFLQKQNTATSSVTNPSNNDSGNKNQSQSSSSTEGPTTSPSSATNLKDGTYTGDNVNVFYGNLQVQVTISGGKITDIQYPVFPNDSGHTQEVSNFALPQLKQEAIQSQSANVNVISGATQTSQGFVESLSAALAKAQ